MSDAIKDFIKAQSEMGAAIKNAKNPFLKNSYADLAAVQDAIFPVFHANNFAIVQTVGANDLGKYVDTTLLHVSEWDRTPKFHSRVFLEYKKGDMQSLGGAITYARRYGLLSVTGVPVSDDDGNAAVGSGRMKAKQDFKENRLNNDQMKMLDRADRLKSMLANATPEQLIQFGPEAHKLIDAIRGFNAELATELEQAYNSREAEVLKS